MGRRNRRIDPVTRDYIADGVGGYETTTTVEPQVYRALAGERGRWWRTPDAGSELYQLHRRGNGQVSATKAADMVRRALDPLVAEGLISDVSVTVEKDSTNRGRMIIRTQIRDVQYGALDVTELVPFGFGGTP